MSIDYNWFSRFYKNSKKLNLIEIIKARHEPSVTLPCYTLLHIVLLDSQYK